MSINAQIKKLEHYEVTHRSAITRLSALAITVATLFSITGLSHHDQQATTTEQVSERSAASVSIHHESAEKNETVRMPIRFDDGLRAPVTTGQ